MIGSPFLFLPTPTHPVRSLDNDIPDAGAALEFDQRRRMVVQRLDIGRPQVVVSPLRVQHLEQRRFAPAVRSVRRKPAGCGRRLPDKYKTKGFGKFAEPLSFIDRI